SCSCFFLQPSSYPPSLHSFPTRRSSDLADQRHLRVVVDGAPQAVADIVVVVVVVLVLHEPSASEDHGRVVRGIHGRAVRVRRRRSEEHTSELQSRENLVCRLLLEKTKVK